MTTEFPTTFSAFFERCKNDLTFASYSWALVTPVVAVAELFFTANYSRFFTGKSLLHCALPGAVGWFLMEIVSPGLYTYFYIINGGDFLHTPLMWMWNIHYTYRCFIYPGLRWNNIKPMPLEIALLAMGYNSVNGWLNGVFSAQFTFDSITASTFNTVCFCIGAVMWLLGFIGNIHSDEVLRSLRKNPEDKGKYKIPPPVGMHRFLFSPNYSCECFEWLGYYVASSFAPAPMTFFVWTVANLGPRTLTNYKWYKKTFPSDQLPKDRKIFIPFIW